MSNAMRVGWKLTAAFGVLSVLAVWPAGAAEVFKVEIDKVAYALVSITARVGDTIAWTNKDIVGHTATARDKEWDLMILPNKTQSVVLKHAGAIEYYCRFHPNMVGHITVSD